MVDAPLFSPRRYRIYTLTLDPELDIFSVLMMIVACVTSIPVYFMTHIALCHTYMHTYMYTHIC